MARVIEWMQRPGNPKLPPEVVALIARRRRQMLVHCYLYYEVDEPVISDHRWMKWAQELAALQHEHGHVIHFYDRQFADWDGSTGFHIGNLRDSHVERVALRLLQHHKQNPQKDPINGNTEHRHGQSAPSDRGLP